MFLIQSIVIVSQPSFNSLGIRSGLQSMWVVAGEGGCTGVETGTVGLSGYSF